VLTAPRRARLPEKLLGSEAKVKLLILFRENPMLEADVDELARRIGMNRETLVHDLADLAELGLLRRREVFSLDPLKDHELQATMSQAIETGGLRNEVVDLSREAEPVGLPLLDRLLPSGLPDSASIMLGADPVSGVFELCLQVAIQWLRKGRSVVYITTHRSPEEVRDALLTLGTEAPQYEEREQLAIVDSYWYLAEVHGEVPRDHNQSLGD
jgi:DNA-binding transcriptional ArsR family regulator